MKINFKKIIIISIIICICLAVFMPITNVFGVTGGDNESGDQSEDLKLLINALLFVTAGPLTKAISGLIMAILLAIFMLLWAIFAPITGGMYFPWPDKIIFNQIPFFDPNFINPTTSPAAPVNILQSMIRDFYYTGFIVAGTVFLVSAMLIGIKLAISTIASEKAHYKNALVSWIVAFALLFTTHFIMLAVFTVNEKVVETVSDYSKTITFEIGLGDLIPFIGDELEGFLAGAAKAIDDTIAALTGGLIQTKLEEKTEPLKVKGYMGLIFKFAVQGAMGDISSAIILGIILGQTCALIVMYIKRLFYSIVLGISAPLIIAADVIKKTL